MRDLKISLVQCMLHWEDAVANLEMFGRHLSPLQGDSDLIVLPEMFNTGFSMQSEKLAETMDGRTVTWMKEQAVRSGAAIYGSAIITEAGQYFNRGLFVRPNGSVTTYDKRHLFRMAREHKHFSGGRERVVVNYNGWRILLQVCYDLRFPVFSRNRNDHDLMLYVANWPEARRYPWSQLLIARAIENLSFVIGVNRVGMDGNGTHYSGDSVVIDAKGAVIASAQPSKEAMINATLDHAELIAFREKFPSHLDSDEFELKL